MLLYIISKMFLNSMMYLPPVSSGIPPAPLFRLGFMHCNHSRRASHYPTFCPTEKLLHIYHIAIAKEIEISDKDVMILKIICTHPHL